MTYTLLKEVIDSGLLNHYPDWFVAGGYAADPVLANDIDIWIQVEDSYAAADNHAKLQDYLAVAGFQFERQDVAAAPQMIDAERLDKYGANEYVLVYKVAIITAWRSIQFSKPVHLLITTGTVDEVLNNFDISTHAVALLPNGKFAYSDAWTPKTVDPVILRDTPSTPARFVKIQHRYASYRKGRQSVFTGAA